MDAKDLYETCTGLSDARKIGENEELHAEIERLKSELVKAFSEVTYQRTLITELADRLEKIDHNWPNEDYGIDAELIQRAREATK